MYRNKSTRYQTRNDIDFWGKIERDKNGDVLKYLSLYDHSVDVAACMEALLGFTLIRARVALLGGLEDLDICQQQRLCVLGGDHDIGKFGHGFQDKRLKHPSLSRGHVREVLPYFTDNSEMATRFADMLGFAEMSGWATDTDTVCRLLIAAICHHGRPEPMGENLSHAYWRKNPERDPLGGVGQLTEILRLSFPHAWTTAGRELPDRPAFQHAVNGLVTLADWIASDTRFFPLSLEPGPGGCHLRIEHSRKQARHVLRQMGIDVRESRSHLVRKSPEFIDIFGFSPNDVQRMITNLPTSPLGAVSVLEAPTGAGKTEAAVMHYLNLLRAGRVDGLYFALPVRTAAIQIFRRVVDSISRAFPDRSVRPPVTLAVPGYYAFDEQTGCRLSGFEVLWDDDDRDCARFRGWASEQPKRYLAGSVVVGTIDQVLLSQLAIKHAHLRATALLRQLLVIDEVHASDIYMTRLTAAALGWHLAAGGHALLMSATLSGSVRQRLLRPGQRTACPPLKKCEADPFPLITFNTRGASSASELTPASERSIDVTLDLQSILFRPERIAQVAFEAAAAGAHVLLVRNTVADCLKAQSCLEVLAGPAAGHLFQCEGVPAPHHSRFARQDRIALDDAVERFFGRMRPRQGVVLAATQTIQQSLDLDADLLISDLCPMDVLLQRIGRLFRHLRDVCERPEGFRKARVIVLVPEERDLGIYLNASGEVRGGGGGIGTVYEDLCVLEATWRLIAGAEALHLPGENRRLVEGSLHPEVLDDISRQAGERWVRHRKHMLGIERGDSRIAELNLLNWEASFDEREVLFPGETSKGARIGTRLGEGDRWVPFPSPFIGPFGRPIELLTLPAHQARGLQAEIGPEAIEIIEGGAKFRLEDREFIYDRWGLRPAKQGEKEENEDVTP